MISIVIPTLNEEGVLERTLACLRDQKPVDEVVIADGGSRDGTLAIALRHGCRVVQCHDPDRATQLNAGAALAGGDVLLFLHADTCLTPCCLPALEEICCRRPDMVGGAFSRRFDSSSRILALSCRLADWRGRHFGLFFGDQAIFARRHVYEALGGFRPLPAFEDMDFSRRLNALGPVTLLRPRVLSSARRFAKKGPLRVTLSDFWLTCRFLAGISPEKLVLGAGTGDPLSPAPSREERTNVTKTTHLSASNRARK